MAHKITAATSPLALSTINSLLLCKLERLISLVLALKYDIHATSSPFFDVLHRTVRTTFRS